MTLDAIDFSEPRVAVDGNGVTHVAFTAFAFGTAPQSQQYYGRCASNCTSLNSWSFITLGSYGSYGGRSQLVVGPNNSLHMLYSRESFNESVIIYARCTQTNCTTQGAWSTVEIPMGGGFSLPYKSKYFAVDSNGVPAFVYISNPSSIFYVRCSQADCMQASSWLQANVQNGGDRIDLQFQGTTVYMGYLDFDSGTGGYATCASNCFDGPSWSRVEPFYVGRTSGFSSVALGVTATGAVHLAYNQGSTNSSLPMAVKQNDGKLQYWACGSNCLTASNWAGVSFATDQGDHGVDLALLPNGKVALATANVTQSEVRVCAGACTNPATVWSTTPLDSTVALTAFRSPQQSTPCGSTAFSASWYPSRGHELAFTSNQLKVLSGTELIYLCTIGGQYASMGGPGRYTEVSY